MILKTIQLSIVAITIANLNRHSTISVIAKRLGYRKTFQSKISWFIDCAIFWFFCCFVKFFQKVAHIIATKHLPVFFKTVTKNRFNTHLLAPIKYIEKKISQLCLNLLPVNLSHVKFSFQKNILSPNIKKCTRKNVLCEHRKT